MAQIGTVALALALGLSVYGAVAAVLGARRRRAILVESARTASYSLLAMVAAANAAMLVALLSDDFSVRYVAENSSRATPTFFKVLVLWSADRGSLLLWNLVLAGYVAAVAFRFRGGRRPAELPWALAVLHGVAAFYLALVVGPASPFEVLAAAPPDGRGPLPLLQNHPLMAAHPPALYLGFIGFTVPFAFAIGAMLAGRPSATWLAVTRRWTLAAWVFLTAGLVLGALWSYGVLGWGGYWAWDPVENVALLPWLTATAFLHSAMLEERRGLAQTWNLSLVVATFALVTLGTFLTRGSILASVHAFADSLIGPMYLAFLIVILVGGFGLVAARGARGDPGGRLDSAVSREGAFVANNFVLVGLTLVVLLGTILPLAIEALSGERATVGEPYFVRSSAPLLLLLLLFVGVGTVLPWGRATPGTVPRRLAVPALAGALVMAGAVLLGARGAAEVLALGLAAFVAVANLGEIRRRVRGPLRRQPSRVGGYVAHLGIAVVAAAVVASSFGTETEVTLRPGRPAVFGAEVLRLEEVRRRAEPHRRVIVADVAVSRDGERTGTLTPSLNLYPGASEPIGTPAIRWSAASDLYASLVAVEGDRATLRLHRNPGVSWLWVGGVLVAAGGAMAAARRPARSRGPARAVVRREPVGVP
ncbi:MAG TPA: cytochrome c-type biogenesis CcmF C-terminal domain-containing protein [Actinomycetota bacterium]|nr:cytochrome c-type biogenesis CcmF C-terminal domain-containing protein [Actinomycetota bacterium]